MEISGAPIRVVATGCFFFLQSSSRSRSKGNSEIGPIKRVCLLHTVASQKKGDQVVGVMVASARASDLLGRATGCSE